MITSSTLYYMLFIFLFMLLPFGFQIDLRVLVTFWPEVHFWHFKSAAVALCFMHNEDSKFPARDVAHRFKQFRLEG